MIFSRMQFVWYGFLCKSYMFLGGLQVNLALPVVGFLRAMMGLEWRGRRVGIMKFKSGSVCQVIYWYKVVREQPSCVCAAFDIGVVSGTVAGFQARKVR